jgi:predicted metalloendopeptidase
MNTDHDQPGLVALSEFADDRIRPQDDLFGQVNGRWLESAVIPDDLSRVGGFIDLVLQAEADVGDILREAADDTETTDPDRRKMGDLYASFMDEERIEALGSSPLEADLADIESCDDLPTFIALLGRLQREGVAGAVGAFVNTDDRQSDRYVVNLVQGGLGLPDESYYREDSFAPVRADYVAYLAATLSRLGQSADEAAASADAVMALEARLAAGHWDNVRCRDVLETYNLLDLDALRSLTPHLDWDRWFEALAGGKPVAIDDVLVRQPSYLEALDQALAGVPLSHWKAWATFHTARHAAPYLDAGFVEEHFGFYGRVLTGSQVIRERWKRAVDLCGAALGEAVGAVYVDRHFPPAAKAEMQALVDNLVEAYRLSIGRLDWMTAETRDQALAKLDRFRPKIGYPDRWRDYSGLVIDRSDLVGNVRRASAFETDRQLAKLGGPVDRDEWFMTPQTVNAYYNPGTNEICFPAAILQPPFFRAGADAALNYGGIGAVIGHELGHGFDDQGSHYDGEGNLVDWWSDVDRSHFRTRADRLIAQYDGFEPRELPGQRVNGALTVGENIGDLGGITIALLAYEISLGGEEPPVIDGHSGRERLFRNWALVWRIKVRKEMAKQLLAVDPHAPPEFRANVVRNLDEFHETFATAPGDGLWLDPADRVRIW